MLTAQPRSPGVLLRVAVKQGGATGFVYDLKFEKSAVAGDYHGSTSGVSVIVDKESWPYLVGTVIDYESGPAGTGFKFINPNAK